MLRHPRLAALPMFFLALSAGLLSACGGEAVTSPSNDTGGSGGSDAGAAGGSGGSGGIGGAGGVGGSGAIGGSGGIAGSGGTGGGYLDGGPVWCYDNTGCSPYDWCDFEPAAPGMCSTGGKAGICTPRPAYSECPIYDMCPGACGCDGGWFCDACEAHSQGVQVTEDNTWCTDGGSGSICGGKTGQACAAMEYCDYPADQICGYADGTGLCRSRPQGCPADCPGVCGCDGNFYCNECTANATGIDITGGQECLDGGPGTACGSDMDCNPALRCCYPCGIPGCSNECTVPDINGQCPMFG